MQAEAYLKQCIANNDRADIAEAYRFVQGYWAAMRNVDTFATIFVRERPKPHVAMAYPGLPPHYVAFLDAEEKAKQVLSADSVDLAGYYFLDPVNIYAKLKTANECTYVNVIFPDKRNLPKLELLTSRKDNMKEATTYSSQKTMAKSMSPVEIIIDGVPAYNSCCPPPPGIPSRSCRQVATAMVLGYWDDRGYDKLIDGGGSNYMGQAGIDGWLNLVIELSQEMGYGAGSMNVVPNAIKNVCNNSTYNNNYEFNSNIRYYSNVANDWDDYCSQIDAGRPFIYQFNGTVTVDTNGVPATWTTCHAVAGIGYKRIGNSSTQKWRIVHYNSSIVDDPCYICEADMNVSETSIVNVIPGGGTGRVHMLIVQHGLEMFTWTEM